MNSSRRSRTKDRDRILRKYPDQALGMRFARSKGSTSRGERNFLIVFILILALACFILGIIFWTYPGYSTLNFGGRDIESSYYPLRIYAIMLWIMAAVFAFGGNFIALTGK